MFISFEGLDGSGKSEQLFNLAKWLFQRDRKADVLLTREPTGSEYGERIRNGLLRQKDSFSAGRESLELYVADRKWHVRNVIKPALAKGQVVLCDRFKHSSYAYQQVQGIPFPEIHAAHKGIPSPDLAIIMDVPAEEAMRRISLRGKGGNEKFEQLEFLKRLRRAYLLLPKQLPRDRFAVVEGTGTREGVFARVRAVVEREFFS